MENHLRPAPSYDLLHAFGVAHISDLDFHCVPNGLQVSQWELERYLRVY